MLINSLSLLIDNTCAVSTAAIRTVYIYRVMKVRLG